GTRVKEENQTRKTAILQFIDIRTRNKEREFILRSSSSSSRLLFWERDGGLTNTNSYFDCCKGKGAHFFYDKRAVNFIIGSPIIFIFINHITVAFHTSNLV
ncbi:hypothetical protein FRX31_024663, partial [Thalictrum thalictroides]